MDYLKEPLLKAVLGAFAALVAMGALLLALFFVLYGAASGLASVSGRPWLGYLLTGLLVLFAVFGGLQYRIRKLKKERAASKLSEAFKEHPITGIGLAMAAGFVAATASPQASHIIAAGTDFLKMALSPVLKEEIESLLKKQTPA